MIDRKAIETHFLDLEKVLSLTTDKYDIVNSYYREMLNNFEDHRLAAATSMFNSLLMSGYLINDRDSKIKSILNEDDSIS